MHYLNICLSIYINVNFAKHGSKAWNFLSGKREWEGGDRDIGSKLGTATGNFLSGKRDGER
jgi:hypothetical protein